VSEPAPAVPGGAITFERLAAAGEPRGRRVLFVTNMWPDQERPYYGSFIASQGRSLAAAGVEVDVLYVRGYRGSGAYLAALRHLPRLAAATPYELVHIHYGHTAAAGIAIRRRPLVVSFCGGDLLGEPRDDGITHKSRAEVAVFRQVARLATSTITKSREMEEALPRSLWPRNHVLPNGVDMEAFAPRPRDAARAALGWEEGGKVMLFIGDPDDPRKNVELARAAAELVVAEDPEARLEVAWGVEADQVPTLMNAADCLVFPSRSEGSPNVVKEAMASALPVVSTPVGDVEERLDGVANCFVRPPTAEAFAPALRGALAAGEAPAARTAVERLGIAAVAEQLLEIYDEAGARHAARRGRS
jgi:glycosyltransferase involved in cell wall biosynthesis